MPGRLSIFEDKTFREDAKEVLSNIKNRIKEVEPSYNLAPTHKLPILLNTKTYVYADLGLIPSWAKDKKTININARSETLFEKKSFKDSFKSKRCLIPVNGFFEWEKKEKSKIPYYVKSKDDRCLVIAGLWDEWYDSSLGQTIISVAIITTEPNKKIEKIHDRMPVILEKKHWSKWLDGNSSLEELNKLFVPYLSENLEMYKVNQDVNSVSNNSIKCIQKCDKKEVGQTTLF